MKKNKKNRREFLEIAGLSAVGIVVASSGIEIAAEASPAVTRPISFEEWILQTGASKLPPELNQILSTQSEK